MRRGYPVLAAWLLVFALIGPVGAAPGPPASTKSFKDALYEAARREGQVNLWGPPTETIEKFYPQEFQKAFPGITVRAVGDAEAPQKLLTEALARRLEADLFWWPLTGFLPLYQRGLVAKLDPAGLQAFGIPPEDTMLEGTVLRIANVVYTLAYDTRRFKPADLPKRWEDLLEPRWRGRVVSSALLAPGVPAFLGLTRGEAVALDFARQLRDAGRLTVVPSSRVGLEMVLRGEKDLLIWLLSEVLKVKVLHNEPVDWVPVSPTLATQHVFGVLKRGPHLLQRSPRHHAALLLLLWAGSREGKAAIERVAFEADARPGSGTSTAKMLEEARVHILVIDDKNVEAYVALTGRVRAILFGGAQ